MGFYFLPALYRGEGGRVPGIGDESGQYVHQGAGGFIGGSDHFGIYADGMPVHDQLDLIAGRLVAQRGLDDSFRGTVHGSHMFRDSPHCGMHGPDHDLDSDSTTKNSTTNQLWEDQGKS